MYLIFDTETTGFIKPNANHDDQPYLVQLGGLLIDREGQEHGSFDAIVKRDGWSIPPRVAEIHGIDDAVSDEKGLPLPEVLLQFETLVDKALVHEGVTLVAHNMDFDIVVVNAAYHRAQLTARHVHMPRLCTMKSLTKIVGATKANGQPKWPKLIETHLYYFNEGFEDAHSALADCKATARCLVEALKRGDL